ncbi:putative sterigmatocystin biosynthesis cytochrome P450 monooxygenase [Aspergillus japonicus CBS 114.51]|uniref:Putative sterigmatocystin biosynthesis cytochrome P450 monooxygenase n=2 Tax=Aspergillus TaxID=5052 RepID=A0A2V5GZE3_ASPV1|nr:putative sterigmatocystin biosynthesis cytochrome P450 monooxygenase [Aspergillus japonicus CBS 114.51]PYI13753.1 putative sterigmatocystin biosynthesis cytochrome P450 monooxygenase [Aspergillus violaceofuscus CBS 115571]RAH81938.1 putative sterigmatocystin biosynthesis cytochrome P450 monooxygenase [Aspergillus japonicus CBS 114.51]
MDLLPPPAPTSPHSWPKTLDHFLNPAPYLRIRGQLESDIQRYHTVYGSALRYGHHEVSFTTAQAWKDIYGHGHSQLPRAQSSTRNASNIIGANDTNHARYRKALAHASSPKALQAQELIITGYLDQLLDRLRELADRGHEAEIGK